MHDILQLAVLLITIVSAIGVCFSKLIEVTKTIVFQLQSINSNFNELRRDVKELKDIDSDLMKRLENVEQFLIKTTEFVKR